MSVEDAAGHIGVEKGIIPVDILVVKDGDNLKIMISSIIFDPDAPNYTTVGAKGESNKRILQRLSEILKKYNSYKIVIEGHAHNIYGNNMTKAQRENLISLSKKRAESVKGALVNLGIGNNRISTLGIGADKPLFTYEDVENNWKNRRVEFILIK